METQDRQLPIGKIIRDARRAKRLTGMQLAQMTGCTQSAISQFEGGKTTALRQDTIEKIAKVLDVTLPEEVNLTESAVENALVLTPPAPRAPEAAFCPNSECPSNLPYMVGDELVFHPRRQPNPAATFCPWCGELLIHTCPECGAPVTRSAFCTSCGAKRVEAAIDIANPSEWAKSRLREISEIDSLI